MINEDILEILDDFKIKYDNAICYLLALFYGYKPDCISDELKIKLNITKIYEVDKGSLIWNVPLFQGQITAFEWVKTEYCKMFKETNISRAGNVRESTDRLKKLFAKNPEIRKDDVINATKMYLLNTDSNYIMMPHYFIEKGMGADKTQTILTWIDKYKELQEEQEGRNTITNTMQ